MPSATRFSEPARDPASPACLPPFGNWHLPFGIRHVTLGIPGCGFPQPGARAYPKAMVRPKPLTLPRAPFDTPGVMARRLVSLCIAYALLFAAGWTTSDATAPSISRRARALPSPEARLLALARENGCLDAAESAPIQSWPDWAAAHIAGGDVPPARVIADPYPTLHS